MSKEILPQKVDPYRLADKAAQMQGLLSLSEMARLRSSLSDTTGDVTVQMEFGIDEQDIRFIRGKYTACLILQCQRCLKPLEYIVEGSFLSGLASSEEEATQLPKAYEPLIVIKDDLLLIKDMIEDELLISLPIVPMHKLNHCIVKLPYIIGKEVMTQEKIESPFKVIELLRAKKHNSE